MAGQQARGGEEEQSRRETRGPRGPPNFPGVEPVGGRGPFLGELRVGRVVRKLECLTGRLADAGRHTSAGTSSRPAAASRLPNRSTSASRHPKGEAKQGWLPRHPGQGRAAEQEALARFAIGQWEAGEGGRGAETAGGALSSPSQFLESLRRRRTCAHPNGRTGLIKGSRYSAPSTA